MSLLGKFQSEVACAGLSSPPAPRAVAASELAPLPEPARRYLRFMRVLEHPRVESFRVSARGRFRLRPDAGWMKASAWQYNAREPIARLFYMTVRMARVLPVLGRDTYREGRGRMQVRPLDLFTVEDGRGPEYDLGELVTWLNDGALLAPSMLLGGAVAWNEVDADSFELAVTDHGRTARARVLIDGRGAPVDFQTTDRYYPEGKEMRRGRWSTPVSGMTEVDGRPVAAGGRALWRREDGDFCYAELEFVRSTLAFNVAP
jgi:uncharacterized protein DUF6544